MNALAENKTATHVSDSYTDPVVNVFHRQQRFALTLRPSNARQRLEKLNRLGAAITRYKQDIYDATFSDFKKPSAEVDLAEIFPIMHEIAHAKRHLKSWMKAKRVPATLAMLGTQSAVRCEPKGVCLIISPWNYPLNLSFGPLVSAIAAGNTAIIKPSEMTPHCSALIKRIVEEVFDPQEVAVFEGAAEVSTKLLTLPFNHIFFTGSPAVGRIIMKAASEHLASVTLELGGKSPVIIDETANLKAAARNVVWGKFSNNGQTCIAPDHVFVHKRVLNQFVAHARSHIEAFYGKEEEQHNSPDYCRIVNERHYHRLSNMLKDAKEKGGTVAVGGLSVVDDRFISPTLLTDTPDDATIMQEEIFGPLLPIISFSDIDKVLDRINQQPKPLALYIYSKDNQQITKILANTSAGGTCINHSVVQFLHGNLPFGGVNNSGLGSSHGYYGFKAFSHERSVLRDRFSITHWLFPPYTASVKRLINLIVRFFT